MSSPEARAVGGAAAGATTAATGAPPGLPVVDEATRRSIEAFLFLEARLADESRYGEWLALMADDVHYWVPNGRADYDPATRLSYVNDNRARLATRVRQLQTGLRHAQTPASRMRRTVANVEVLAVDAAAGEVVVGANQVVHEVAVQSTGELRLWPGRVTFRLRRHDDGWLVASKVVELVIGGDSLPNLTFLL